MPSGTIVNINDKGYGFISQEDGQADMFFHVSGLTRREDFDDLKVGDEVRYEIDTSPERPRAVSVEKV